MHTWDAGGLVGTQKALTVTADNNTKVYGDTDPALTYEITAGELVGDDKLTGTLTREAGEDAGTYDILQGTLTAGDNYTITYAGAELTITQRTLTVTAYDKSKVFGDTDPAFSVSYDGFITGEDETVLAGTLIFDREHGEDAGEYAITPSGLTSANYDITFVPGTLTINESSITPGTLKVNITPPEAVADGERWKIAGTDTWRESGDELSIASGTYTVTFKSVTGWDTPDDITGVTVEEGALHEISGTYTEAALLPVELTGLTVQPGHLYPAFDPEVKNYQVTVVNTVTVLQVTPEVREDMQVEVNGHNLPTGDFYEVDLDEGYTVITITITDPATERSETYTITVLRLPEEQTPAMENNIGMNFNPEQTEYEAEVDEETDELVLDFSNVAPGTRIFVNGVEITPTDAEIHAQSISTAEGTLTWSIPLNAGDNDITIEIFTGEDEAPLVYQIKVRRLMAGAVLSSLLLSQGELTPSFSLDVKNYTLNLPAGTHSITLTPYAGAGAEIKINEEDAASGTGYTAALQPGANIITITVTSGEETTEYTINVTVAEEIAVLYGDVNNDGFVNVTDAILILRHIVNLIDLRNTDAFLEGAFYRAVVRERGAETLTVTDAILVLRRVVGLITSFPVEQPL